MDCCAGDDGFFNGRPEQVYIPLILCVITAFLENQSTTRLNTRPLPLELSRAPCGSRLCVLGDHDLRHPHKSHRSRMLWSNKTCTRAARQCNDSMPLFPKETRWAAAKLERGGAAGQCLVFFPKSYSWYSKGQGYAGRPEGRRRRLVTKGKLGPSHLECLCD